MATPLDQLLAAVAELNDPREPFAFTVEANRIVGHWDIVKATSLYPTEVEHLDKTYRIDVEPDPERETFTFSETTSSTTAQAGPGGASFEKELFKGKKIGKEFGVRAGGINRTPEGTGPEPVVWTFDTGRIKQPLFAFLEHNGYQQKKGFLSGLFSR